MSFYDAIRVGASGAADFEIERSLRFVPNDTYMEKTPSSAGNRKTWTCSFWVKRSNLAATNGARILAAYNDSNGEYQSIIKFRSTDTLQIFNAPSGSADTNLQTNALFRDVSAWYHIVVAVDMTQSTASDRVNLYINGVQETSFGTENYGTQNTDWWFNNNSEQSIGRGGAYNSQYFDGYLAEFNLIDGLQLTPSSFGKTNSDTGQWVPIDTSGLTFGTNGFRLQFADNSGTTATTLGKDTSGNSNNYTPYGFSVAAGAGNDSLSDTPTNNFATINGVFKVDGFDGTRTLSEGNLAISGSTNDSSGDFMQAASIPFPLTGKWYVEATVTTLGTSGGNEGGPLIGIMDIPYNHSDPKAKVIRADGKVATTGNAGGAGNSQFTSSFGGSISQGDVWQLAYDADNRYVYFGKNNNWANGSGSYNQSDFSNAQAYATQPTAGIQQVYIFTSPYSSASMSYQFDFNFGQRAFAHTPPTGYEQLKSANLPDPTILLPNKHFDNLLWTGDGNDNRNITGLNFQPDWVWIKERSSTSGHVLVDAVRGIPAVLESNTSGAEDTSSAAADIVQSFNSDGFQVGTSGRVNQSGQTNVGWNWNAGDTDGKTYAVTVVSDSGNKYRFDGFGTSAVTLDLAEGGTYIFDQSDSSNAGHPLRFSTTSNGTHGGGTEYTTGVTTSGTPGSSGAYTQIVVAASAPTLYYYCSVHSGMGGQANTNSTLGSSNFDGTGQVTAKVNSQAGFSILTYSGTGSAGTKGHGLGTAPQAIITKRRSGSEDWKVYHQDILGGYFLKLNSTQAQTSNSDVYPNTAPTSTVYSLGNHASVNGSGDTYIAYVFSEVAGYSKFGSYVGNGNANGVFVFCGFRPAWVFIKSITGSKHWVMNDSARNPHNVANKTLLSNASNAEDSGSSFQIDILSNGFKCRTDGVHVNTNAGTHIFFAFAESPFKNARAR